MFTMNVYMQLLTNRWYPTLTIFNFNWLTVSIFVNPNETILTIAPFNWCKCLLRFTWYTVPHTSLLARRTITLILFVWPSLTCTFVEKLQLVEWRSAVRIRVILRTYSVTVYIESNIEDRSFLYIVYYVGHNLLCRYNL